MGFKDIAEPLARIKVPTTPVRPNTKQAFLPDFPTTATTDLDQIYLWDRQYPNHNGACVARAEDGGVWFFEVDSSDVIPRIKKETGHDMPSTFMVRSRPGRGHYYFRHTTASMVMGNISQTYVVGQDWSVRTNREYVVAPGSLHPDTGKPYEALNWSTPIAEAPDWLIAWLLSQKIQKQSAAPVEAPRNTNGRVPHGSIHGFMLREAGRLRAVGLTQAEIETALLRIVHEQCEPPIDDSKVIAMARSICIYPPGPSGTALTVGQAPTQPLQPDEEPEEAPTFDVVDYPIFPRHVMFGTGLYENYVKPYCEKNSRIPEFMWMPAVVLMMNYLGPKVKIPLKGWMSSLYLVVIGQKGRANKSSSIKDAMRFFEYAGMLSHYSKDIKNADGKSIVWEAGSPEGLGTDMQRTNCKNAVLFYDELSALVSKAGIEGSGMNSTLLKMYESANFSNSIKTKKDTFSIEPGSYCASLITATTDKKFTELWAKLAGQDTGLDDRFFFLLEPQVMPAIRLEEQVNYTEAALAQRKVIDGAVNKKDYKFFDQTPLQRIAEVYGNRAEIRAEKFALYFAIDMGLSEIDEDCVYRGIELVKYEQAVKKYLMTFEAKNDQAALEIGVVRLLKKNKGAMETRKIERLLHVARFNTTIWRKAYQGLAMAGYINEQGRGVKGDPKITVLLRDMSFGDDE